MNVFASREEADGALGYFKRVMVTPGVHPRLFDPHHFDMQGTVQKPDCGNTAAAIESLSVVWCVCFVRFAVRCTAYGVQ